MRIYRACRSHSSGLARHRLNGELGDKSLAIFVLPAALHTTKLSLSLAGDINPWEYFRRLGLRLRNCGAEKQRVAAGEGGRMLSQAYSLKNLKSLVKWREPSRFQLRTRTKLNAALQDVIRELNGSSFHYKRLSIHHTKKGDVFSFKDFGSLLTLRKLNYNLTKLYKVKQSNRQLIIRQIRALLEEPVPKHIIKLDISQFYESIDRAAILAKVKRDPLLSLTSKGLLEQLYSGQPFQGTRGFPRGLSTSATLSELYLRDFDKAVTAMEGVYFYTRYVDDILVFCFQDPRPILNDIRTLLTFKFGLYLNEKKTDTVSVGSCVCADGCRCNTPTCECKNGCVCIQKFKTYHKVVDFPSDKAPQDKREFRHLDYLGYRFSFPPMISDKPSKGKKEPVFLTIAPKKMRKIKSRIATSLACFSKDHDFNLLKSRLVFLTSNYKIGSTRKRSLNAGIYFNYPLLSRATPEARKKKQLDSLDQLDAFLRHALFVGKFKVGAKARAALNIDQKRALAELSFSEGFEHKIICKLTHKKMEEIAKAWIYEKN